MVYAGGSIEAILKLNATPFKTVLDEAITEVNKFKTALSNSTTSINRFYESTGTLNNALTRGSKAIERFNVEATKLKQFRSFAGGVNDVAKALRTLSSEEIHVEKSMNIINNMFKYFQNTLNGTQLKIGAVVTSIEQLTNTTNASASSIKRSTSIIEQNSIAMQKRGAEILRNMGYTGNLSIENDKASASMQRFTNSTNTATASTTRQTSATRKLYMALSSIRTIGFLAGSMLVYNFASNLVNTTRETVNAKSEMEGYFKMLHFTTGQVDNFNKALDETVKKFPRLNKYALGETISSIGVEFELTTQEMEKAMPVVSMITSEYLRAGRNVNEASLAVKDILQGEFQRLSRETGVKGDQLKEAGWSGDKNDVMGLLDALKKVGESRNWDTFVVKANSLNDAVLILQNRFSEWGADMVNVVQPAILSVFNNLMSFGQGVAQSLSGMWKWLNSDGWGQTATKIGLVTSAILVLMPALTSFRSGAKLLQVANMSLTQSLGALVFGLNAETFATHTSSEAIAMNLLGIKQEELEKTTLVAVINGMIASRTAETVATDVATASNLGFTGGLMAMITGEAIAEGTTISLTGALGLLTGAFLTSPIGWFTLAIVGLASAFYVLTGGLSDTWDKMKEFNEIMKDTGSAQKEAHEYLEQVKKDAGETSRAFHSASREVKEFDKRLQSASYWYNHAETEFNGLDLTMGSTSKDVLKDYGISDEDVDKWNANLDLLNFGKNRYYKAEQVLNKQIKGEQSNYAKDLDEYLTSVEKSGGDLEEAYGKMTGNYQNLAMHSYIANTSDDWWEKSWNQLYAGMDQFWIDWDKFWADTGKQFAEGDILSLLFGEGDSQTKKDIIGFGKWLEDGWKSINDGLASWQKGAVDFLKPLDDLGDEVNKFIKDPIGYLGIDFSDFNLIDILVPLDDPNSFQAQLGQWMSDAVGSIDVMGFLNDLFVKPFEDIDVLGTIFDAILPAPASASDGSSDHPSFMEDVSAILGFDVQQWITDFQNDPLGTLGIEIPDFDLIGTFIDNLFNNNTESGEGTGVKTFDFSWIPQAIYDSVKNAMETWVGDIDIVGFITNLIPSNVEGIYQWAMDNIITPLVDGVKQGILNTPILGDVASLLGVGGDTETSSQESGQTVGTNFTTGIQTGLAPLDGIINSAFQGLNLDSITSNFTSNTSTMVTNATSTATSVGASFVSMKNNHKSSVDSMVNNNTTAFRDMQVKSNTQMLAMRDSTSNVTHQMTNAWTLMKDSIIASATKIKNDSKSRFDTLGQTIGGFYKKIQNPSLWGGGAGYGSTPRRVARNPSVGKALVRGVRTRGGYAGGLDSKSTGATMSVAQLKKQLCPSGDCGGIFDGYKSTDEVNVWEFLQGIGGNHGLGGWNFAEPHNTFIKNKSDAWGTAPPIIDLVGGIHTSTGFKVGEFNNGTPKVSFSTFEQIATAIFSRIPYRLYFDSSWKGSWLGALQAGACNCYDGALALMALASTFGFSTGMGHGTWTDPSGKKTAHVWAIINGVKMDTTGMQQRGTWRPSASAGGSPTGSSDSKTVNVTVDMSGATIYGVDDLDSRIQESVSKGLQAEFNDPYTITI